MNLRIGRRTNPAIRCAGVSLNTEALDAQSAARLLDKNIIASASPYRRQVVRLSASLVNDEAEVERALAAVRAVAAQ